MTASRNIRTRHGLSKSREFKIWQNMKSRCYNANRSDYAKYGGRGTRVCDAWLAGFSAFFADMGRCPEGMSLDRIDSAGNYEPSNCRWSTPATQAFNTRFRAVSNSGRRGVYWHEETKNWRAMIGHGGKSIYLGMFATIEDATEARRLAEVRYYGCNSQEAPRAAD